MIVIEGKISKGTTEDSVRELLDDPKHRELRDTIMELLLAGYNPSDIYHTSVQVMFKMGRLQYGNRN